jgi:hypothetical protein
MLSKCANPSCKKRFRYLREGKLFSFPGLPGQLGRNSETRENWWLCAECANVLTVHFDLDTGITVLPKTRFECGECIHVPSLYRAGMIESYCNRCGRFLAASATQRFLGAAEAAHQCVPLRSPAINQTGQAVPPSESKSQTA